MSCVKKRLEGICPGCQNDRSEYVREGIFPYPKINPSNQAVNQLYLNKSWE